MLNVQRPTLASSWQPFFTSSPSFSAHATESLLSLQGKEPLTGHPKTLRDLTQASQLLTLPSTFGAIQLGETFTSCLCVNNEAAVDVEGVSLRIEMQTATNKLLLAEVGGPDQRLSTTDVLEALVSHEMKELGQHVLACHVSYRLPSSVRIPPDPAGDSIDPSLQTFRKYYKFAVSLYHIEYCCLS
jgi:trafficking protein particle complex subunit 13